MKARQRIAPEARRRQERREPREEFDRGHDAMLRAATPERFQTIGDPSPGNVPETFEGEWRARAIAAQAFATEIIVRFDPYGGVQVEAAFFDGQHRRRSSTFRCVVRAAVRFARTAGLQCGHGPADHRDDCARLKRSNVRRLVRARFERHVVKQPYFMVGCTFDSLSLLADGGSNLLRWWRRRESNRQKGIGKNQADAHT